MTTTLRRWAFSFVLCVVVTPLHVTIAHSVAWEMADAANHFLTSLAPDQKAKALFEWKDEERLNWHFIPKERKGLPLKEMTAPQRLLAQALLASALSSHGHARAATIMSLEQVLQDSEGPNRRFPRDPELYFVSIFGTPGPEATWGWRFEGHHLAFNFTIVKGQLAVGAPSFYGSNPAQVRVGSRKGLRALASEEDLARKLIQSLDADQRTTAIVADKAPNDIYTAAQRRVDPLKPGGLPAARLTEEQKRLLRDLIGAYTGRCRPEMAAEDWKRIESSSFDQVHFAWEGGVESGQAHYYRVQGPTFLLEYDNIQNDANHIHAVWRDFANDFGEDLLRKHYAEFPHPSP